MNYYLDTEFLEGVQSKKVATIEYGKTKPTIDLISIGIVCEDGRKYYAVSKSFNLKEAWNRLEITTGTNEKPYYWIRENVLRPIFDELEHKDYLEYSGKDFIKKSNFMSVNDKKSFNEFEKAINRYGKTNKQIAQEIKNFVTDDKPVFYGYYADYDWVVFAQLFGTMMNIPDNFPYYCRDLKQMADEIWEKTGKETKYPVNTEHHALSDAEWNKDFHEFLMSK